MRRMTYEEGGGERSLFDDTVIIFTSSSGALSPQSPEAGGGSNSPLRGGQGDLLEGGTRVPAFISNLGTNNGAKINSLFHMTDWLPTIVQGLAGGRAGLDKVDGVNQVDVLKGLSEPLRTEVLYDIADFRKVTYNHSSSSAPEGFQLTGAFGAALRVGERKLVLGCSTLAGCARNYNSTWDGAMEANRTALYDLAKDPGELVNLAEEDSMSAEVEELRSRLDYHLERAVLPIHEEDDQDGLPLYSFPLPAQLFTSWCNRKTTPQAL